MKNRVAPYAVVSQVLFTWFLCCLISSPALSQSSAWTSGGPYAGESLQCLVASPGNPEVFFAGGYWGIYQSTDSGVTWTKRFDENIQTIDISASNPDHIYAGSYFGGVYKSEDGGLSWQEKGLSDARVNALVVHPTNPDIVYVGTGEHGRAGGASEIVGVFKTDDGGESWTLKTDDGIDAVLTLLLDTANPDLVYAGVAVEYGIPENGHTLFRRSTDGGETWQKFLVVFRQGLVAMAMTPTGYGTPTIYTSVSQKDVYKSVDSGQTWTQTDAPWTVWASTTIAVDPTNPEIVYSAGARIAGDTFYRSLDGGGTWSLSETGLPQDPICWLSDILIHPGTGDVTVPCLNGQGVFRSNDRADSWDLMGQVLRHSNIRYLAAHPDDAQRIYAVTPEDNEKLTVTLDGGASWFTEEESPVNLGAVAIDPSNLSNVWLGRGYEESKLFYVHHSQDSGNSWAAHLFAESAGGRITTEVTDILIHPNNSDYLLVGTNYDTESVPITGSGAIARSLDGGMNWEEVGPASSAMSFDPGDANIIYSGKKKAAQVFRTTDIWGTQQGSEITPSGGIGDVNDIEVDMDSKVYVAASDGLWKWDGNDWTLLTSLPSSNVTALAIDHSATPVIVYAGTHDPDGIFVSEDGGATWTDFNDGKDFPTVNKLVLSEGYLFAATHFGGVWKREAIGATLLAPDMPVLVSPEPSAFGLPTDITLTWSPAARANVYQVQLSKSADFTNLIVDQGALTATSFNASGLELSTTYYWRVRAGNSAGQSAWSATEFFITGVTVENPSELPTTYDLLQNYPNPFNPSTTIVFEIPVTSSVRLTVYDILGRQVTTLVDQVVAAGVHEAMLSGKHLPSGSYLYRLETPKGTLSRTMLVLK